jgi:hypothetical protein
VKAGLVERPEEFPYCFTYVARRKAAGAKALELTASNGTAEAMP